MKKQKHKSTLYMLCPVCGELFEANIYGSRFEGNIRGSRSDAYLSVVEINVDEEHICPVCSTAVVYAALDDTFGE